MEGGASYRIFARKGTGYAVPLKPACDCRTEGGMNWKDRASALRSRYSMALPMVNLDIRDIREGYFDVALQLFTSIKQ